MKNIVTTLLTIVTAMSVCAQDSSQIYFKKGLDEKTARRYMVAANYFDKAIKFNPNYTEAYIENAHVNLEMRKIDAAQGLFAKAFQLQPTNLEVVKELTTLYFNGRQFQKAIDLAQKCNCADADRIIGMSNFYLEDYLKASVSLKKYLAKNPNDAEAQNIMGRTLLELDDYKNALPPLEKSIALDKTKNVWMYELGLVYYTDNDFKNALKYFVMAENAGYNKTNDFCENIGFAYLHTGDKENGMKNLSSVLAKKPNNKELLSDIAQALYQSKQYDDALTYYQRLLELNPNDASTLYMAGMAFQKKGEKEKGQAMCDKAINMDPSLARNRTKMGENVGL